ncbi:alpha/beta hydrolase [Paenibacillus wulumuqiensis]|uniref:alpha/beta hydrolase n=1 Tax=Paenibacillus wulumuqiensis TaxID=1567107 RepID=UPI0006194843|nr:alpha/beta hydrolase [Paenibacillus wulumuqiensis]
MSEIKHLPYQSEDNYFVQLIPDVQFTRFPNGSSLKMNILRPVSHIPLPLIVWVVGGSWVDVDNYKHVPVLSELAAQGYVIACIQYRTVNRAPFPAQLEDVKTAIRFLRTHAEEYGIDAEHVGVWGHSAGGHLAALAGVTGSQPEWDERGDWQGVSSQVTAVVDFCGPIDVQADFQTEYELPVISLLMGGPIRHMADNAAQSNPVTHIQAGDAAGLPPFLIMHGDQDEMVPLRQSRFLYDALLEAGAETDMYVLEGARHSSTVLMARQDVMEAVSRFFAVHLKGS